MDLDKLKQLIQEQAPQEKVFADAIDAAFKLTDPSKTSGQVQSQAGGMRKRVRPKERAAQKL